MIDEDLHLEVLRLLEREPDMSQRQLARALGLSVAKTHYAIRAEHKALMTEIEQRRAELQGTEPADEPPTP